MSWMHWRNASVARLSDGDLIDFASMLEAQTRNVWFLSDPGRWDELHDRIWEVKRELELRGMQLQLF